MKKLLLVVVLMVFGAGMAMAGVQDFTIYNDNDYAIEYIYVSPSYADSWEEDVLGDTVLYAWDSLEVTFDGYDTCSFDILIVDEYGDEGEVYNVDLCGIWGIHFEWDYQEGVYYYWTEDVY